MVIPQVLIWLAATCCRRGGYGPEPGYGSGYRDRGARDMGPPGDFRRGGPEPYRDRDDFRRGGPPSRGGYGGAPDFGRPGAWGWGSRKAQQQRGASSSWGALYAKHRVDGKHYRATCSASVHGPSIAMGAPKRP